VQPLPALTTEPVRRCQEPSCGLRPGHQTMTRVPPNRSGYPPFDGAGPSCGSPVCNEGAVVRWMSPVRDLRRPPLLTSPVAGAAGAGGRMSRCSSKPVMSSYNAELTLSPARPYRGSVLGKVHLLSDSRRTPLGGPR
jgi:hypothetical protein